MWKKLSKILLAAMLFFSGVILIPFGKAHAIGVDTVVKAAGGKMVVRGLAEKAGMALSPRQLDNVVDVIEKKTFDGDPKAIDFMTKANNVIDMPSSDPASKTGFKKYVVDPLLWVSGLDLIFDVVQGFSDGYESSTEVEMFDSCAPSLTGFSNIDTKLAGPNYENYVQFVTTSGSKFIFIWQSGNEAELQTDTKKLIVDNPGMWELYSHSFSSANLETYDNNPTYNDFNISYDVTEVVNNTTKQDVCKRVPVEEDVIDISNVDNSTKQHFDNDTYNTNTVYNIELELPDSPDYNNTEPWNEPDVINIENEIDFDDSDGDGIGGNGDGDDDGSGEGKPVDWLVVVDDEIPIHEKFFLEMADMGQKVEDMYNGVVHFFDVTIDGFTTLTDGMTGFVAFLDDFFDWLPAEYVALLGSGFTLGVVSFFLRR